MFSQRQKRRCSIRIWILIINDSFKKSSRAFTGLGPSEEPGELIVENVPLKWVLKIHWLNQIDLHNEISEWILKVNLKKSIWLFWELQTKFWRIQPVWVLGRMWSISRHLNKNGSSTLLTFIVTKNLNSYNLGFGEWVDTFFWRLYLSPYYTSNRHLKCKNIKKGR